MSRTLFFATFAVLVASSLAVTCTKPKVQSTTFTTRDATIVKWKFSRISPIFIQWQFYQLKVSQIGFIAEFSLDCAEGDASGFPLFAEINGRLTPVVRIKDNRFQVSFLTVKSV